MTKSIYKEFLRDGETLESVSEGTLKKRKHDHKKRQANQVLTADKWRDTFDQSEAGFSLDEQVEQKTNQIAQELQRPLNIGEQYLIDQVVRSLIGFKEKHVKTTVDGVLVAGSYFPEVLGDDIVPATHRYQMEQSPTYSQMYRELLQILSECGKPTNDRIEIRSALNVKLELEHKFELKRPEIKPKPEVKQNEPEDVEEEILQRKHAQAIRQLQGLPPDASSYLENGE